MMKMMKMKMMMIRNYLPTYETELQNEYIYLYLYRQMNE